MVDGEYHGGGGGVSGGQAGRTGETTWGVGWSWCSRRRARTRRTISRSRVSLASSSARASGFKSARVMNRIVFDFNFFGKGELI